MEIEPENISLGNKDLKVHTNLDCFASSINKQLPNYVSYTPDPNALYIDAFTVDWSKFKWYMFPPFRLIASILEKLRLDQAEALIINGQPSRSGRRCARCYSKCRQRYPQSWRKGTFKQYKTPLKAWTKFCHKMKYLH